MQTARISVDKAEYQPIINYPNYHIIRILPEEYTDEEGNEKVVCHEFAIHYAPTLSLIKSVATDVLNRECSNNIEYGMKYNDTDGNEQTVWLTSENQQNYKSMYDMAMAAEDDAVLDFTVKIGSNTYLTLNTKQKVRDFYFACVKHIQNCQKECWQKKDTADYSVYGLE